MSEMKSDQLDSPDPNSPLLLQIRSITRYRPRGIVERYQLPLAGLDEPRRQFDPSFEIALIRWEGSEELMDVEWNNGVEEGQSRGSIEGQLMS